MMKLLMLFYLYSVFYNDLFWGRMKFNVAVIMCVYKNDQLNYLIQAIDSITINQREIDSKRIHVYLHIDGPVNHDVLEYIYINKFIYKVLESKNNVGLAVGLNKILETIEDEKYIFRMDADDIALNDRLIKQISFMEANKNIDVLGGAIKEFINNENNIVSTRHYPLKQDDILKTISKASPFAHVTICFRRKENNNCYFYPINYPLNEDIALWFKILKLGVTVSNINDCLVLVRMDGAYSRRTYKKAFSEFKVYLNIAKWKKEVPVYPTFRFIFRFSPSFLVKAAYNSKLRKFITNR